MPRHWQHTYCTEFWLRNARAVRSSGEGPLIAPIVELLRASRKLDVELCEVRLGAKIPAILSMPGGLSRPQRGTRPSIVSRVVAVVTWLKIA